MFFTVIVKYERIFLKNSNEIFPHNNQGTRAIGGSEVTNQLGLIDFFPYHSTFQNVLNPFLICDDIHFMKKIVLVVDDKFCHFIKANKGDKELNIHQF